MQERERSYLTTDQIRDLLEKLAEGKNRHAAMIAKVCLATGARWSEAEKLEARHIRNSQIQFAGTKSGKVRAIPIEPSFEQELRNHHEAETGQRLFAYAYSACLASKTALSY